jgi:hypothetical protein
MKEEGKRESRDNNKIHKERMLMKTSKERCFVSLKHKGGVTAYHKTVQNSSREKK